MQGTVFERLAGWLRPDAAARRRDATSFQLQDYLALLDLLLSRGVKFQLLDTPIPEDAAANKLHYLKHDIHHDLARTWHMAAAEAERGVKATYFMMPKNFINRKYFDRPETWNTLRQMQRLGHHLGLHVDGFLLVEEFGDLAAGIAATRQAFAAEGIELTVGNTHGNSQYQAKFDFEPMNFYREVARPTPCRDEFWMAHYARYSLADLGFRCWADTAVWAPGSGERLLDYFVSDNSTGICAGESRKSEWDIVGEKWDLSPSHRRQVADLVRRGSCIYLIHPQFYRPATA